MEKIKILIVEDELIIAEDIKSMLHQKYIVTGIAINYEEAIESMNACMPDIAMIDINLLGQKNGIELAHHINMHFGIPFIFATSLADENTMEKAKETHPYAYLIKPFEKSNVYSAIEIAVSNATFKNKDIDRPKSAQLGNTFSDVFFVKKDYYYLKILAEDIEYIKSDGNYLDIFCKEEKFIIRSPLKNFAEQLNASVFRQIHKSYIVNLKKIDAIAHNHVLIHHTEIPLSQAGRSDLLAVTKRFS